MEIKYDFVKKMKNNYLEILLAKSIALNQLLDDRKISRSTFINYIQSARLKVQQMVEFEKNKE